MVRRARLERRPFNSTPGIVEGHLDGPYSRTMPWALRWSQGGGLFLMSEVPLQARFDGKCSAAAAAAGISSHRIMKWS